MPRRRQLLRHGERVPRAPRECKRDERRLEGAQPHQAAAPLPAPERVRYGPGYAAAAAASGSTAARRQCRGAL
jgi:hypothetical protein